MIHKCNKGIRTYKSSYKKVSKPLEQINFSNEYNLRYHVQNFEENHKHKASGIEGLKFSVALKNELNEERENIFSCPTKPTKERPKPIKNEVTPFDIGCETLKDAMYEPSINMVREVFLYYI